MKKWSKQWTIRAGALALATACLGAGVALAAGGDENDPLVTLSYLQQQALPQEEKSQPKVNLYKLRKERESELRKKRSALARLEQEIEENDRSRKALEQRLEQPEIAADYEAVTQTSQEIGKLQEVAEGLLLRWTELSEELEALERAAQELDN